MADTGIYSFIASPNNSTWRMTTNGGTAAYSIQYCQYLGTSASAVNTTLATMYAGTNLQGLVTAAGNYGWQKFVVPKDGKVIATVRGGAGGVSHSSNLTINAVTGASSVAGKVPGRGAKLVGSFNAKKGDVLYILVGFRGTCNNAGSGWGAAGGGASVILRENASGPYTFGGTNKRVEVLMVAGGGGGTASQVYGAANQAGGDASAANGTNTNGGVLQASTGPGKSNHGGTGAGLTGNGIANSGHKTMKPIALIQGTALTSKGQIPSTWGGGAPPQAGGGGGGGYSGGNASGQGGGYGGTSYMNPTLVKEIFRGYATVAEDKGRDLTNPYSAYGHVELNMKPSDKRILVRDSEGIKYFNGVEAVEGDSNPNGTNQWELLPEGTELSVETYQEYGRFSILNKNGLDDGPVEFLCMAPEETSEIVISGKINKSTILQTTDANLADVSLIKSVTAVADTNMASTVFAVSKNSGRTWQTFDGVDFVDIDIKDRNTFAANGYSLSLFSSIPIEVWNNYNAKNIRFAFCITQNAESVATIINSIKLIGDLTGSWRKAKEAEATYEYTSIDNLKVSFTAAGNYKVNYLDNLGGMDEDESTE